MQKYRDWIKENVLDTADGLCLEWSTALQQAFPELKIVKGRVRLADQDTAGHYWCETKEGIVVDPTPEQFYPSIIKYEKHGEAKPTGKCQWCGKTTYEEEECCSVHCYSAQYKGMCK